MSAARSLANVAKFKVFAAAIGCVSPWARQSHTTIRQPFGAPTRASGWARSPPSPWQKITGRPAPALSYRKAIPWWSKTGNREQALILVAETRASQPAVELQVVSRHEASGVQGDKNH